MKKNLRLILISALIAAVMFLPALSGVFAAETEVAKNMSTGTTYTSVEAALNAASSGQTVMIIENTALTSNATVKSGVTLLVPYKNANAATEDGAADTASTVFATSAKTYRTLTINEGVTLTVTGTLTIGGIIGYPSQCYEGHTSGAHGKIVNNGTVSVAGTMNTYGFVEGVGNVSVTSGGKVYEPFVVFDFAGGSNTRDMYNNGHNPFNQYTMQNISCTLSIAYGGRLYALCNLYAGSQYNPATVIMIGTSGDTALVKMTSGGSVTRTVDKNMHLTAATFPSNANYNTDIGKVTYTISGGCTFGTMSLRIKLNILMSLTVTTKSFAIPYCTDYILLNGTYGTSIKMEVLPGGGLIIGEGATFNQNKDIYVLDGLRQSGMSGWYYPTTEKLAAAGFPTTGRFVVNGTFNIQSGVVFGGIIQTETAGATVTVNSKATVTSSSYQFGCTGSGDDNTSIMQLNGRLFFHNNVTQLEKGKTYTSYTGRNWTLEGYDIKKYCTSNGVTSNQTYAENVHVTTNQPMNGEWTFDGHTIVTHPAQEPSCTGVGWGEYFTCEQCPDYTTYAEIPALGHDYHDVVTAPTCTEQGYTVHTCSRCEDSYTDTYVPATGHTAGTAVHENETPATCTSDGGYDEVVYCTVCGSELSRSHVTIEHTGHSYTAVETKPATYSEEGELTYTCSRCGDTYTEPIAAIKLATFSASLSLKDSIDINLYVKDIDKDADLSKISVVYTFVGKTSTASVDNRDSNRITVASCSAKEIGDSVNIIVYYDGRPVRVIDYSIRNYCENKLNESTDEKLKTLCKAVLDYGACAQTYFDYKTDNLANSNYPKDLVSGTVIPESYNIQSSEGSCSAVKKMTVSLSLESRTEVNIYILLASGKTLDDITVGLNGVDKTGSLTLAESGAYCLTIPGISANKLDQPQTVTVTCHDGEENEETKTVIYSPLTWAFKQQTNSSEKTANLAKALFNYFMAAAAYL
ncbi:MAG: hypothetical protein J5563_03675 [Clostridia bacterium]|nr:hypothetical protein [Clostridia bacterium]